MISINRIFYHKIISTLSIATCSIIAFSGCQSTSQPSTSRTKTSVVTTQHPTAAGKSTLNCSGTYACEIDSIGKIAVINQLNHKPSPKLSTTSEVTVFPLATINHHAKPNLANYVVSFPSGQQVVTTRFYLDETFNTIENFSFIHSFESGKRYELKAYRQIQKTDYSLLAQSAPTPLCIDLYENTKLTNKWCKKPNQQGALSNEFIKVAF